MTNPAQRPQPTHRASDLFEAQVLAEYWRRRCVEQVTFWRTNCVLVALMAVAVIGIILVMVSK